MSHALPEKFIEQIDALAAIDPRVAGLAEALTQEATPVAVRFNRRRLSAFPEAVGGVPTTACVPWCPAGSYLSERPQFTLDPALHQGLYYVQEASSMFISHVIRHLVAGDDSPRVYLDACAAPGGKTTAAIDALPEGSLVVANEWDYRRAAILAENVMKWGYPGVIVSRGDTSRFTRTGALFDIIAADVPCSGEGMMRKDPEAVAQWSPGLVKQCAERQREIIDNLWEALKPGGAFIYSTCTFNREENEEMVQYLIDTHGAEPVEIPTDGMPGISGAVGADFPAYRFMPHRVTGEGLFMAVLRKSADAPASTPRRTKSKGGRADKKGSKGTLSLPPFTPNGLEVITHEETLWGIPSQWREVAEGLLSTLDVLLAGVEIGTVKGRDVVPSQGLALSTLLDLNKVSHVEVDRETALNYLRREAVTLPDDAPRGHVLLTHGGHPLGWVKNLGNRANNLYPANWRIHSR